MDFPLFRSLGAKPSVNNFYGPTPARGFPVHRPEPMKTTTAAAARTPRVVQIPVHFVGPDSDRSLSALKIQKVFRGFIVRKSMKKIMAIKKEVDEIEARVSRREEVELIKEEEKERLKVNEMLMALLFKLDSIPGVDSGVRDCRRTVIKKAIALQEKLDSISSSAAEDQVVEIEGLSEAGNSAGGDTSEDLIQNSDTADADFEDGSGRVSAEERNNGGEVEGVFDDKEVLTEAKPEESGPHNCEKEDVVEGVVDDKEMLIEVKPEESGPQNCEKEDVVEGVVDNNEMLIELKPEDSGPQNCEKEDVVGGVVDNKEMLIEVKAEESGPKNCEKEDVVEGGSDMDAQEENCVEDGEKQEKMGVDWGACVENVMLKNDNEVPVDSLMEDNGEVMCEKTPALSDCVEEASQMEDGVVGEEGKNDVLHIMGGEGRGVGGDDNNRDRELLERMMEENKKMMKLTDQLYERNEVQTRMLNCLSHRLEQLEKAFVCDKIKRKKKRHSPQV
ncbi:hypothetical protein ACH5RR_030876 [Cinchona calisaya]|uniref:BAG domain-containing protein n=1 Tax=Cinchona calisaya TaxID=153742 RepID=A0ABD2YVX7_9GENT